MKFRIALFLLILAACGFMATRLVGGKGTSPREPLAEVGSEKSVEVPPLEEAMREAITVEAPSAAARQSGAVVARGDAPRLELTRGKLGWEEKIEAVLSASDLTETAKARQLFTMLPVLPEHALTTAAEEAIRRVPETDYGSVALPVVANPQTHGLVLSVLFADLMERPDATALPALLRLAQTPQHPYAPYALDNLNLLLDRDFGTDWPKWDAAIRQTLVPTKP